MAARADILPKITGGVNAGRYGLIETARDYDVRANVALTMRLGGGGPQRADQAHARARVAQAQYDGTREKAVRDAAIARSEEHTSELKSLMRTSYAVFCLKKKKKIQYIQSSTNSKSTTYK